MNLTGFVIVKCGKSLCDGTVESDSGEFDLQQTWTDEDRGMGEEIFYSAEVYKKCPECGEEYTLSFECSEYPAGAPNYEDFGVNKDAKVIKNTLSIF
ncbi:MAG: hypothetical protein LKF42_00455 [Streptococcaceae bacterium]|nr:hypothetical protein [Streptococcaceae bacterium]MCH4176203.1 hypothetical protein [Streptococcaceae bacterium]